MPDVQEISDVEIILRRIPPRPNCIIDRPGIGLTATSFAIQPRKSERGPSWTRLLQTRPQAHLDDLRVDGKSPEGWLVCRLHVRDVREFGLDVVHDPTDRDPGHCEIRPTPRQPFTGRVWSRLAKRTRILTAEEVASLQAGDRLSE